MPKEFEKIQKSYDQLQIEELKRGIHALAVLMFEYHKGLLEQGFDEKSALYLVAQYQNTLMKPRNHKPEETEDD